MATATNVTIKVSIQSAQIAQCSERKNDGDERDRAAAAGDGVGNPARDSDEPSQPICGVTAGIWPSRSSAAAT